MCASPIFEDPPPPGYVSAKAKGNYILAASVLIGFVVVAQFVVPMVIQLIYMPSMMFGGFDMTIPHVERCAAWQGGVWYPEESLQGMQNERTRLRRLRPGAPDDADETERDVDAMMSSPWLLAGEDLLWLIAPGTVGFYENGAVTAVKPRKRLGEISRPFLHEGHPAVVEAAPDGHALWRFIDGEWEKLEVLALDEQPAAAKAAPGSGPPPWQSLSEAGIDLQVVPVNGTLHVFRRKGETLYYREGLPIAEEEEDAEAKPAAWEVVARTNAAWYALELDGRPVVFYGRRSSGAGGNSPFAALAGPKGVTGLQREDGRWESFFTNAELSAGELGVCALDGPEHFLLLASSGLGEIQTLEVAGGRVVEEKKKEGGSFFPFDMENFVWMSVLQTAFPAVLSLVLVLALAAMMKRYRECEYYTGGQAVRYASLTRRMFAKLIDTLISSFPWIPLPFYMPELFDFTTLFTAPEIFIQRMATLFMWLGAATCWWLLVVIVLSYFEGTRGATPGKWVCGIRVFGKDLQPRGFLPALGRNLLILVDGFFSYVVGIALIAFLHDWQRLGDLAAGTIVVQPPVRTIDPGDKVIDPPPV